MLGGKINNNNSLLGGSSIGEATSPARPSAEIVLGRSYGGNFENRVFTAAQAPDGAINLTTTGEATNFPKMLDLRASPGHKNLEHAELAAQLLNGQRSHQIKKGIKKQKKWDISKRFSIREDFCSQSSMTGER